MLPPVALRGPEDLLAVLHVVAVSAAPRETPCQTVLLDEGRALFVDQGARLAGLRVHFDHAVNLVAALIVFECETAPILPPHRRREVVGIGKQRRVDLRLPPGGHVEQRRISDIQRVARLGVRNGGVFRLKLVGGRRFDVVHLPVVAGARVVGHQFLGIRRPRDRAERVVVAFGAIQTQRGGPLAGTRGPQEYVEVLDERIPLAVERAAHLLFLGCLGGSLSARGGGPPASTSLTLRLGLSARRTAALPPAEAAARSGGALLRRRLVLQPVRRVAAHHFGAGQWVVRIVRRHAAAASTPRSHLGNAAALGASVVRQRACPQETAATEADAALPIDKSQRAGGGRSGARAPPPGAAASPRAGRKRQSQRGVWFATGRGDGGGQLFVIESRLLRRRPGIHQDESRAAFYRPGIPEMVRLADPVGRARNIHHQSLRPSPQRLAALIIG